MMSSASEWCFHVTLESSKKSEWKKCWMLNSFNTRAIIEALELSFHPFFHFTSTPSALDVNILDISLSSHLQRASYFVWINIRCCWVGYYHEKSFQQQWKFTFFPSWGWWDVAGSHQVSLVAVDASSHSPQELPAWDEIKNFFLLLAATRQFHTQLFSPLRPQILKHT